MKTFNLAVILSLSLNTLTVLAKTSEVSPDTSDAYDTATSVLRLAPCRALFKKYLQVKTLNKAFAHTIDKHGNYSTCAFNYDIKTTTNVEKKALKNCNKSRNKKHYVKKFAPKCKLLAKGNNVLLKPRNYGLADETVDLVLAAKLKSFKAIKSMLDNGADINQQNKFGSTALLEAVKENRIELVKYLLKHGADLKHKENMGFDALNTATFHNKLAIFKLLLSAGADIHTQTKRPGNQPIHHAAERGNLDTLKILLDKGVKPSIKNNYGETPLHKAADRGQLKAVEFLLENGAEINAQTNSKSTPLDEAIERGNKQVAAYLKSKGAIRSPDTQQQ